MTTAPSERFGMVCCADEKQKQNNSAQCRAPDISIYAVKRIASQ
jgi:hypothetical protein